MDVSEAVSAAIENWVKDNLLIRLSVKDVPRSRAKRLVVELCVPGVDGWKSISSDSIEWPGV